MLALDARRQFAGETLEFNEINFEKSIWLVKFNPKFSVSLFSTQKRSEIYLFYF